MSEAPYAIIQLKECQRQRKLNKKKKPFGVNIPKKWGTKKKEKYNKQKPRVFLFRLL